MSLLQRLFFGLLVLSSYLSHAQSVLKLGVDTSGHIIPMAPRINYGHKLEPDYKIYSGAGQSKVENALGYIKALGNEFYPAIYMDYIGLEQYIRGKRLNRLKESLLALPCNSIPQIGLAMTHDGKPETHYEGKVAIGEMDDAIDSLCKDLNELNRPVFIRVGYEFNGEWNGYQPETFIAAYKRVTDKIRKSNPTMVAIVWCFSPDGKNHDFMKYYPGDEWVDWWAVDVFAHTHFYHEAVERFVNESLNHKMPLMIGESTSRRINLQNAKRAINVWEIPYFNFIHQVPNLKAFCYINCDWSKTFLPDWGDARLETSGKVSNFWKKELGTSSYLFAEAK